MRRSLRYLQILYFSWRKKRKKNLFFYLSLYRLTINLNKIPGWLELEFILGFFSCITLESQLKFHHFISFSIFLSWPMSHKHNVISKQKLFYKQSHDQYVTQVGKNRALPFVKQIFFSLFLSVTMTRIR